MTNTSRTNPNADAALHLTEEERRDLETGFDLLADALEALFAGNLWAAQSLAYRSSIRFGLVPAGGPWR